MQQEALGIVKIFWLISEANYPLLRKIEGCDILKDLKATITDNDHIIAMADHLGIPKTNRFINISSNITELKTSYKDILQMSRKLTVDGTPHVIFTYVGGHGATQDEKQVFLLNSEDSKNAFYHIEYKLRYLVKDETSLARIFAVFDCCRVPLKNFAGLVSGRGGGNT